MHSIICAGYGGQGVLTQGLILANVSMEAGKKLTWVPSYGSEMRGGTASCRLRISDDEILNPYFSRMTTLIAMNNESVDMFESQIEEGGILVANTSIVRDREFRPDLRVIRVPATEISQEKKNPRGANIVMLGAAVAAMESASGTVCRRHRRLFCQKGQEQSSEPRVFHGRSRAGRLTALETWPLPPQRLHIRAGRVFAAA